MNDSTKEPICDCADAAIHVCPICDEEYCDACGCFRESSQQIHYRVTWENAEGKNTAEFWLPATQEPKKFVGSLLNLVELNAGDDFGYRYELETIK